MPRFMVFFAVGNYSRLYKFNLAHDPVFCLRSQCHVEIDATLLPGNQVTQVALADGSQSSNQKPQLITLNYLT